MEAPRQRDTLLRWAEAKDVDGVESYQRSRNVVSIDGLPTPMTERFSEKA